MAAVRVLVKCNLKANPKRPTHSLPWPWSQARSLPHPIIGIVAVPRSSCSPASASHTSHNNDPRTIVFASPHYCFSTKTTAPRRTAFDSACLTTTHERYGTIILTTVFTTSRRGESGNGLLVTIFKHRQSCQTSRSHYVFSSAF